MFYGTFLDIVVSMCDIAKAVQTLKMPGSSHAQTDRVLKTAVTLAMKIEEVPFVNVVF